MEQCLVHETVQVASYQNHYACVHVLHTVQIYVDLMFGCALSGTRPGLSDREF